MNKLYNINCTTVTNVKKKKNVKENKKKKKSPLVGQCFSCLTYLTKRDEENSGAQTEMSTKHLCLDA